MEKKPESGSEAGICPYHDFLGCSNKSTCSACGWNPKSDIRKRRIAAVLRDREERLRTGKARLYL